MNRLKYFLSIVLIANCTTNIGYATDYAACLEDCLTNSDFRPYIGLRHGEIKDTASTWILSLTSADTDTLLDVSVPTGGSNQPIASTTGAFTDAMMTNQDTKVADLLDNYDTGFSQEVTIPTSSEDFKGFNTVVNDKLSQLMKNYVDELLPEDGTFLDSAVEVNEGDAPADLTRNAFKSALSANCATNIGYITDAGCLDDCLATSDFRSYIVLRNDEFKDTASTWILSLTAADTDTLLDESVPTGDSNQPVDSSTGAVADIMMDKQDNKVADLLGNYDTGFSQEVTLPTSSEDFPAFNAAVSGKLLQFMKDSADELRSEDGAFLYSAVEVGVTEAPADRTRDLFKYSLGEVSSYGSYNDRQGGIGGGNAYRGRGATRGGSSFRGGASSSDRRGGYRGGRGGRGGH